jgi:proline iminopeptidase
MIRRSFRPIINLIITLAVFTGLHSCNSDGNGKKNNTEGFIEVEGGKVWYHITGAGKPGIPLLVLHGGPGIPHDYLEPLEALADERPVIFYDQLGCGNSDNPADTSLWNLDRFVRELVSVRKELGLKKLHILGQSWGSMLAVEYMIKEKPTGIKSLIFSGPCMSTQLWISDQKKYIEELPDSLRQAIKEGERTGDYASKGYQDALGVFYAQHVCRMDPWPDCIMRAMGRTNLDLYSFMWGPSEFTSTGNLRDYDNIENLGKIKVPVLWTCGEFDEATPASTELFKSKTPGSQIHVFAGASHSHHLEMEEEYIRLVRDFIGSH